jgi:prolyl-tRNA synthetase
VKENFSTILKIQKALEKAGVLFADDEAGEIGLRLQIGKRRMKAMSNQPA